MSRLIQDQDFTLDPDGRMVLTARYLLSRGYCCESGCRNCPYGFGDQEFQILPIAPSETYDLRGRILRPGQPREACQYPHDHHNESVHFGAHLKQTGQIIGVASLSREDLQGLKGPAFRLRGMAVEAKYRRGGVGTRLLASLEIWLRQKKAPSLWFNARESAFPFYLKLGYEFMSPMFDVEGLGPHRVMWKDLRVFAKE